MYPGEVEFAAEVGPSLHVPEAMLGDPLSHRPIRRGPEPVAPIADHPVLGVVHVGCSERSPMPSAYRA